ncbi:multiprotein-bridging factor 1, variant 2 [Entomophthora muscae]|uniref:Multiprotein-bridging factor 1, variant 2 n=1 Tax=Entomophthora muscae TaxID=34485 RepID=A0ACC2S0M9_9FUNG|nr:multiprotein-bridging factor 1, variant 2 [Entomophthora muscae]
MEDWDKVTVIRKRPETAKVARSSSAINAARRAGAVVETGKKYTGGSNKGADPEFQRKAKIDAETDAVPPPSLGLDVGKAIQKYRQEKGWTQKDLGQRINEKSNVINDYEMGRAIPNQQLISKIERNLGVKLRGKNIGEPLFPPKK